ncbi:meteorin-like protein [Aplochiton taeniatus]
MVWFVLWRSGEVNSPLIALWIAAVLLSRATGQYSSDQCSWRGSGLSHESHRRDVEQVYLRCSQGSVEWLYPTGAIILNLRPNTEPTSGATAALHVCIKPRPDSQGAQVYVERAQELRLLLGEREQNGLGKVVCFSAGQGVLFIQALGQADISRRITAFQYELVPSLAPGAHLYPYLHAGTAPCKPCSDEEVLMAVCTSDFVGRGQMSRAESWSSSSSSSSSSATPGHASLTVTLSRLLRQKSRVFVWSRGRSWTGRVHAPPRCVAPGPGQEYLLTGSIRFGEPWLGCAPSYKDFLKLYLLAEEEGTNPCNIHTD